MVRRISLSIILCLAFFCCSGCIKSEPKTGLETIKRLHEAILDHDKDFVSRHVDIDSILVNLEKNANNVSREVTKEKEMFRQIYWIYKCPLYIVNENVMPIVKKLYAQELIDMIGNKALKKAVTDNASANFCLQQLRRIFDLKNFKIVMTDWSDEEKNLVRVTVKTGNVVTDFNFIVRVEKENEIWKVKEIVNLKEYMRKYYSSYISSLAELNWKEWKEMRKYVDVDVDVLTRDQMRYRTEYQQLVEAVQVTVKNIGDKGIENMRVAVYIHDGLDDENRLLYNNEFEIDEYVAPGKKEGLLKGYRKPAGKDGNYIKRASLSIYRYIERIEFEDGSVMECSSQLP